MHSERLRLFMIPANMSCALSQHKTATAHNDSRAVCKAPTVQLLHRQHSPRINTYIPEAPGLDLYNPRPCPYNTTNNRKSLSLPEARGAATLLCYTTASAATSVI